MSSNTLRTLLVSAILAISATNGCHGTPLTKTQETTMTVSNDPVLTLLSLLDHQYAELSDDEISDLSLQLSDLQRELYKEVDTGDAPPPPGIWVSTPGQISFHNATSQLLMGLVSHGQRRWEVYPTTNIFLVLRHKSTGQLWVGTPLLNSKRSRAQPRSALGSSPDPEQAATWYAGVNRINIIDRFPNSLPLGPYTATALYFDMASNSAHFSMTGKEGELPEPEEHTINADAVIDAPKEVALDAAKPLKFEARLSTSSTEPWHGNVIALLVDEAPIIIPFTGEADTTNLSITIDLQEKSKEWQTGHYQIYADVGDHIVGPVSMTVTK